MSGPARRRCPPRPMARLCSSATAPLALRSRFREHDASVAQLDRVLPSEGRGFEFKSRRMHFQIMKVIYPLSRSFIVVALLIQAAIPLIIATILFSGYTLLRVITYMPNSGPPSVDPGFAPARNSFSVFLGMEVVILLVALSWVIPFCFISVVLTLLAFVALHSRVLYIGLSEIVGTLLSAGWVYEVRNGWDVIALTLPPFFAFGYLASSILVSSIRTMR